MKQFNYLFSKCWVLTLFLYWYKKIISEDCKDTSELENAKLYWPVSEWVFSRGGDWRVSLFPHTVPPVHWSRNLFQNENESSFCSAGLPDEHFSDLCHLQSDQILEQCGLSGGRGQDSLQVRNILAQKTFSSTPCWKLK